MFARLMPVHEILTGLYCLPDYVSVHYKLVTNKLAFLQ